MLSEHLSTHRIAVLLSLVSAILLIPLGFWARHLQVGPGVVPVWDAQGRSYWLAGLVLAALSGFLFQRFDSEAEYALETASACSIRYKAISEFPTSWIYPALTVFSCVMLIGVYDGAITIISLAIAAFVALVAGSVLRHHLYDADDDTRARARTIYNILMHSLAFLTLSMVYINKVRSLFSATTVLFLSVLLFVQLTEGEDALFARRLVYALAGGVMLGEITWALNYWKATGWTGGAALLVFFYLAAGLISTQLRRGVVQRDLLEYGGVALFAFAIVVSSVLR
jgi:hypothetical protein